ncbi:RagB/SusD family nutrient uptake outer membrane protein [Parabacteroides pacaensis]|uniref:RagB/SusD family nutrient uptake outer membrane protein n=1 Tax=Parabacteroides pacaensis TaxID=2086575 RepID=UPI000D0FE74A|nr:RagB/SusD family nutrient uptake outer membrane protein [Parabacteroides pacaensis]
MTKYIKLIISLCIFGCISCEDYLERYPLDKPSDATFYSTESELIMAVNGIYNTSMYYQKAASPLNLVLDCASDIGWDRDQGSDLQLLGEGLQVPTNDTYNELWFNSYSVIAQCNMLLTNMHKAQTVTNPATYQRIEGEARFFRAYHYHLLVNFFGNIPLLTEPQSITDKPGQTDRAVVTDFILNELEEAAQLLPTEYTGDNIGRVTQGCALSIKAREALFSEKWEITADACKRIINSGLYSLEPDYNNLFNQQNKQSKEVIFFIQYSRVNQLTHGVPGNLFSRMASGYSNKVPSQSLVDSYYCTDGLPINESVLYNAAEPFKNRDPRLDATIVLPGSIFQGYQFETHPDSLECWDYNVTPAVRRTNQDVTNPYATFSGYCWRKYTDEDKTFRLKSELNIILVRYAEVLLMYAEAINELGQMDQQGYEALKLVRERANMPAIQPDTQANLRKLIRQERKVEFAMEGLRFFDIRRWKIAESVMNGKLYGRPVRDYLPDYIPAFDENGMPRYDKYAGELRSFDTRTFNPKRDYLFPIPQKELDINKNLKQNPNY